MSHIQGRENTTGKPHIQAMSQFPKTFRPLGRSSPIPKARKASSSLPTHSHSTQDLLCPNADFLTPGERLAQVPDVGLEWFVCSPKALSKGVVGSQGEHLICFESLKPACFKRKRRVWQVSARTWRIGAWAPGYACIPKYQVTTAVIVLLCKANNINKVNNVHKLWPHSL